MRATRRRLRLRPSTSEPSSDAQSPLPGRVSYYSTPPPTALSDRLGGGARAAGSNTKPTDIEEDQHNGALHDQQYMPSSLTTQTLPPPAPNPLVLVQLQLDLVALKRDLDRPDPPQTTCSHSDEHAACAVSEYVNDALPGYGRRKREEVGRSVLSGERTGGERTCYIYVYRSTARARHATVAFHLRSPVCSSCTSLQSWFEYLSHLLNVLIPPPPLFRRPYSS